MALIQMSIYSSALKRPVPVNAYIPLDPMLLNGMTAPRGPWKTIYLLHGFTGNCYDWLGSNKIGEISKEYNVAIIMPDGENHFWVDAKRRHDLYGQFVSQELIAITRSMFPLSCKREDTTIAGISMGGYGAIRNGLKYPEVFGQIIGCSPAIVIDDINQNTIISTVTGCTKAFYRSVFGDLSQIEESDLSPCWLSEHLSINNSLIPNIFFGCGMNDLLVEPNRRLHNKLFELGIPHEYKEYIGTHEPSVFEASLYDGLNKFLERIPEFPNPFWIDA